ncbi:hypothetical protein DV735_g5456, partial [Chaetothyriales sp. CBS 134920]
MAKRKREDEGGDNSHNDDGVGNARPARRLRAKFAISVTELTSALKLARGFERQKLGRRQKQASDQPHTLLRLREEVIVLKQLDLERTARNYLLKTLSKIKRIRESEAFISVFGASPVLEAGKSGAEANVLGRLFKSSPVKDGVNKAVTLMYKVLEVQQDPPASSSHQSAAGEANVSSYGGTSDPDDHSEGVEHVNADQTSPPLLDEQVDNSVSSGSERPRRSIRSRSGSTGSTDVEPKPIVDFLPSLGMAGYISGSDSETGGDGATTGPRPRKNRRGQRARQHIAELKYGQKAKHLQNQAGQVHTDWDVRRGAVDSSNKSHHGGQRHNVKFAKQRKEHQSGQVSFVGKKTTFD